MRLDRFLWFARLTKTRSTAQAVATNSRLRIDGRPIDRAHAAVRIGNVLTFLSNNTIRVVRIEALPPRRGPAPEARACYTELTENVSQQAGPD
ncbi:RNA-binding S4 domain-containing protein [Sphingomonas sp. So64.6b]|uniref:RNA-binding S4 domain-containing protein n=1 Tax=Sphingomonas sp. So64.6b TaxID=2997354 RepID=UPI0015FFB3CD|nr:S4 domain-containing protein [Sphingomonas sp. So64.6b]QNA87101.1 RNA-binding S4 domain-containing protein [Sphingomonas sp. So64.6b]